MIVIDVDAITRNEQDRRSREKYDTVLIINHKTGIEYRAQTGGLNCNHPTCEGFCINVGSLGQDFDDCSYGCHTISKSDADTIFESVLTEVESHDKRLKLAKDIDVYLRNCYEMDCKETAEEFLIKISFDYDRLNELEEGWRPVTVSGNIGGNMGDNKTYEDMKGYIHAHNCD